VFESCSGWGVFDTSLCDQVCQWLAAGRWFSPGTLVFSTNKTDRHIIIEILLKVAFNTIIPLPSYSAYAIFILFFVEVNISIPILSEAKPWFCGILQCCIYYFYYTNTSHFRNRVYHYIFIISFRLFGLQFPTSQKINKN
jgi:hypothetical protein